MVKAVFADFYGTIVHEDGEVIKRISREIYDTGKAKSQAEIGSYWWSEFQTSFIAAYGDKFKTQRTLEYQSLNKTIQYFDSTADADALSNLMFEHWQQPPIFEEAKQFFNDCPVPIYIVSNIDRDDIMKAIEFHGLNPAGVFTSEDARSYKPRRELFELALKETVLLPEQVVHIGDSLNSDVMGATTAGIDAVWVNRGGRNVPDGVTAIANLLELFETNYFKESK